MGIGTFLAILAFGMLMVLPLVLVVHGVQQLNASDPQPEPSFEVEAAFHPAERPDHQDRRFRVVGVALQDGHEIDRAERRYRSAWQAYFWRSVYSFWALLFRGVDKTFPVMIFTVEP